METKFWIVDDIQQPVEVTAAVQTKGGIEIVNPPSHAGQKYSLDFAYPSEEDANKEVRDRHSRLSRALEKRDLVACLSIQKEPVRKSQGASKIQLAQKALEDRENYKEWVSALKRGYKEVNHKEADLRELAKTLRNAHLIQTALANPLAVDFTEIMARQAALTKESPEQGM